jgi:hypothetical protein
MMTAENAAHANFTHATEPSSKLNATARKAAIALALGFVIAISWMGVLDTQSVRYIDESLKQALVTYGVARGLNAVVSVLQTFHLFGLGIGEALDPINDLVERISSVMELAIGSLFIQKVLLEITSTYFFKVAFGISGLLLMASMYIRTGINSLLLSRIFITLTFLRFSITAVVALNGWVSTAFITQIIDNDIAVVQGVERGIPQPDTSGAEEGTTAATQSAAPQPPANAQPSATQLQSAGSEKKGLLDRIVSGLSATAASTTEAASKVVATLKETAKRWNPKAVKEKLDQVIPQMLNVMALFLLKTLILPIVFLYGLKYALEQAWNIKPVPLFTGKLRLAPRT